MRYFLVLIVGLMAAAQTPEPSGSVCIPQQSVWKQGMEFRHTLCPPGVDVVVSPRPAPGFMGAPSPIAYVVKIENYSKARIDADPAKWRLFWTEKNGTPREDLPLTARQIGPSRLDPSFGRSTIFEGQSVYGFTYFKRPKSKDATIAIVFESEQGAVTARIAVTTVPIPLLP